MRMPSRLPEVSFGASGDPSLDAQPLMRTVELGSTIYAGGGMIV
jgi:hypothetical protein